MNNNLTPKAQKLYKEAELAFQEYGKDCVWDMLDNYYVFYWQVMTTSLTCLTLHTIQK